MQTTHAKNRWIDCTPQEWTAAIAHELIQLLESDDRFLIDAACETRAENSEAQLAILNAGIAAVERALSQSSSTGSSPLTLLHRAAGDSSDKDAPAARTGLQRLVEQDANIKELFEQRHQLLLLQDKTRTWIEMYQSIPQEPPTSINTRTQGDSNDAQSDEVEDSWQFEEEEPNSDEDTLGEAQARDMQHDGQSDSTKRPSSLPEFLDEPLDSIAFQIAAVGNIQNLKRILQRHANELRPARLAIIDSIPLFCDVDEYLDLLPRYDPRIQAHLEGQEDKAWRHAKQDRRADSIIRDILGATPEVEHSTERNVLADWYKSRVLRMDTETGHIENSLSLVQQGASQDLPGLDALGEQLSLLSRLVYDHSSASVRAIKRPFLEDWSLHKWQISSEEAIVDAYLSASTEESIASDIRTRLLPYLYVLESQRERAGQPDPELHNKMLFDWMLQKVSSKDPISFGLVARIFELSKPDLPTNQRIIRSNVTLAQLALACCYGHQGVGTSTVQHMLRIFECLPSFEDQMQEISGEEHNQTMVALLESLSVDSASQNPSDLPRQLFAQFQTWKVPALSRALDVLDLHLEAAEIFSRWNSPAPLVFFVRLSEDEKMQRLWADRLAKTSAAAVKATSGQNRLGQDFQDEDEWISLLDDLCRLGGKGEYSETEAKPAFSQLNQREITKIFFGGLLSSAKFDLAKSLFSPSSGERPLDAGTEVALVLAASREFYDNAETGNLHMGNMKLAFECLAVAPNTPEIRRERDFIEATSRLASFNIVNAAGEILSPLEIRLTQDKLRLVSQLLSSNSTAYQHPDVILELVAKLGFKGDHLAETRVLSMLADAALQNEDAKRAGDVCERMIKTVETTKRSRDADKASQASELAWRTCFKFGQSKVLVPTKRKRELLGHALLLCPPEEMQEVLSVWQVIDKANVVQIAPAEGEPLSPLTAASSLSLPFGLSSRPTTPASISIPSSAENAARAALSVGKAASTYLPFRTSGAESGFDRSRPTSRSSMGTDDHSPSRSEQSPARDSHVRAAIENRFKAGVGWLLGADED